MNKSQKKEDRIFLIVCILLIVGIIILSFLGNNFQQTLRHGLAKKHIALLSYNESDRIVYCRMERVGYRFGSETNLFDCEDGKEYYNIGNYEVLD